MLGFEAEGALFIVLTVLLFMFLGIAILVIVDHKARIPGHLNENPFSIRGLRRDHPFISFLTTFILFAVIITLLFELGVTLGEKFGLFAEQEQPSLIQELKVQRVSERNRHFHKEPVEDLINLGKKAVCMTCHGDYPHSKEPMIRTLLNMHTQFIGCMTCHNDGEKIDPASLSFSWLNFSGIEVDGPPYGTDIDPETGYLLETDDYYSKIVAYGESEDGRHLLEIPETTPKAREFIAIQSQLSDSDREAMKKFFHKTASPKGRRCALCHTREDESYLPFRELGFSEQRIDDITNLNIIGIIKNYRKFYLPNLFEKSLAGEKDESPDDSSANDETQAAEDDPRAWWKKTFDASTGKN